MGNRNTREEQYVHGPTAVPSHAHVQPQPSPPPQQPRTIDVVFPDIFKKPPNTSLVNQAKELITQDLTELDLQVLLWLMGFTLYYPQYIEYADREKVYKEVYNRNTLPNYDPLLDKVKSEEPKDVSKDDNACSVCLDKKKTVVLTPCRHLVLCCDCAKEYRNDTAQIPLIKCPICESDIVGMAHIYV
jgi:predicted Zn-ribbon and HTH transcriptional regulator